MLISCCSAEARDLGYSIAIIKLFLQARHSEDGDDQLTDLYVVS